MFTIYSSGILKAGESRLGKIVKEKISSLFKKSGPADIDIMIRNGTTKFENGIGNFNKPWIITIIHELLIFHGLWTFLSLKYVVLKERHNIHRA